MDDQFITVNVGKTLKLQLPLYTAKKIRFLESILECNGDQKDIDLKENEAVSEISKIAFTNVMNFFKKDIFNENDINIMFEMYKWIFFLNIPENHEFVDMRLNNIV
jgi:hypothetical protein